MISLNFLCGSLYSIQAERILKWQQFKFLVQKTQFKRPNLPPNEMSRAASDDYSSCELFTPQRQKSI
jgi:hypothetical protein